MALERILTEVKRLGTEGIELTWDNGEVHTLSSRLLRDNCPSASSKAERGDTSHEKPLSGKSILTVVKHTAEEQLRLEEIWAVGNYAIGMRWGDGHDSGIYHYDFLYQLGSTVHES